MVNGQRSGAGVSNCPVNIPGEGTTPGTLLVIKDASNLYLAVQFTNTSTANTVIPAHAAIQGPGPNVLSRKPAYASVTKDFAS